MNIISIHTDHDGSITIVKNNVFLLHAQIDRFNNVIASSYPTAKLLNKIKDLQIKFDKVYISFLNDSCHWFWLEMLKKYNLLKQKTEVIYYGDNHHHYFHSSCAEATVGKSEYTVVIDGHGSPLKEGREQETVFKNNKILYRSQKNIGWNYECKTAEVFNLQKGRAFRSCGKLMAKSLYDPELSKFQKHTEKLIDEVMPRGPVTYTGGVAQNVLANSKYKNMNIKIDPLCTDQGISLGVMNHVLGKKLNLQNNPVYLGFKPKYDLSKFNVMHATNEDVCEILKTTPVGIFQGRSEQGQRGLGNRSLLMDARNKEAFKLINKIKKREKWRPFAPAVLEERASEYFDIEGSSPYMLYTYQMKQRINSVCAIDGSSRIQTVSKENNKNFYNLLKCFSEINKIPLLLNTSLNLSGHTLAEDLDDVYYMMKYGNLSYCYLPEVKKLIKFR
jgi:predicted NodU family carbamoyl transferase